MDWLVTGRGSMLQNLSKNTLTSMSLLSAEENDKNYIPLYDIIATAGSSLRFWESEENILDLIPKKFGMRDCDLAIHIYGSSMYPLYMPGDVALLKEIEDYNLINYGQAHVIITEEHRFMKYIMRSQNPTHLRLHSENQHYDDIEIEKKHILKLYQVQGFFRKTGI